MQSFFRFFVIFILSVFFAHGQIAKAQDDIPLIDWQKRLTVSDRLTAFGEDLMGDSVDPHIGSLVFEQTDISLPGNSALDVSLRRRLTQGYKYKEGVNVEFGDWGLVVPRIKVILAATDVRDANGNWVRYSYNSDRLTAIEANDGRKISLSYNGELISTASANGRVWQYAYRNSTYFKPEWSIEGYGIFSGKVLSRVTQPDDRFWSFELDAMQAEPSPPSRTCQRETHILNLWHPYGTKGTFKIRDIEHRQAYKSYTAVVDNCFDSFLREPDAPPVSQNPGGIPTPFQVLTSRTMAVRGRDRHAHG